ncbi:homocysteine s-methyltransferase [Hirsutella rhossiliensis]|uniref:Homocysteine s-methyltransferase domain-containing protein n=1 Tax=Hirsutella rhossiliensis TaxID=111463 RepID=A0A9P8MV30_9HYPO|nr:homocysteine s-methyltransferase domain-containing protein [Hirsutella rhossiliensis]KAH0961770.1 homocysteine s-methyltransferase domain-containing protein [Hirsutella rhossiliensis]
MARRILILDGGLGTSLEQKYSVCFSHDATPLWSSHLLLAHDDQSLLLRCHADFARVPVDVLLTATYQVSADGFARSGVVDPARIPHHLEAAVRTAERAVAATADDARSSAPVLALSLGPYGACMVPSQEYSGRYDAAHGSRAALRAWHLDRLRLFAPVEHLAQRVAYVALETLPRVDEIEAARQAIATAPSSSPAFAAVLPFWISCLYPSGETLPDGTTPEDAVRAMLDPAVAPSAVPWGIGINCTKVDKLDAVVRRYEAAVAVLQRQSLVREWPALVLYPDGTNGQVYNTATQTWEEGGGSPDGGGGAERIPWEQQLADVVEGAEARGRWRQIVVGGCCMATCDDIARLRGLLVQRGKV